MVPGNEEEKAISSVMNMHDAPRFGHSSNIALLASFDRAKQFDYAHGVLAFSYFILCLFILWGAILVTLKCAGPHQVGCAAGGEVLDATALRKESKKTHEEIRLIVRRAHRVQAVFLLFGFLLLVTSGLFLRHGSGAVQEASGDIKETNEGIQKLAYTATNIVRKMRKVKTELDRLQIKSLLNLSEFCPNLDHSSLAAAIGLRSTTEDINASLHDMDAFWGDFDEAKVGLAKVQSATKAVDETIDWVEGHDWMPKMYVLLLDVFTVIMLVGAFMSRIGIVHRPFHCMLAYMILPGFITLQLVAWISTSVFSIVTVINADFCSPSPEGTVENIIRQHGISSNDLVYRSFLYYMDGCIAENPMEYITPLKATTLSAIASTNSFLTQGTETAGVEELSNECGADVNKVMHGVRILNSNLSTVWSGISDTLEVTDCARISPILRRIFYGASCNDCVNGLTCMFASSFVISVCGMVMLSCRAAVYNARVGQTMKSQSRATNADENVVDMEWEEYKGYMSRHYETGTWKFKPSPSKNSSLEPNLVTNVASFETAITALSSKDSEDINPTQNITTMGGFIPDEEMTPLSPPVRPKTGTKRTPFRRRVHSPIVSEDSDSVYTTDDFGQTGIGETMVLSPSKRILSPPQAPKKSAITLRRTSRQVD